MSDLRDLYQQVIFDHYKAPRNCRELADANHKAEGHNPLCGDTITVFLRIVDDVITEAAFTGNGCAISTASASLMTEALKGKRISEVESIFESFHRLVTDSTAAPPPGLGKLEALAGVREFPVRVKCATLAWHTLRAALEEQRAPATTE
jgi:nitrogen fixation NifU-like protein